VARQFPVAATDVEHRCKALGDQAIGYMPVYVVGERVSRNTERAKRKRSGFPS
jgi:hypothetical protein